MILTIMAPSISTIFDESMRFRLIYAAVSKVVFSPAKIEFRKQFTLRVDKSRATQRGMVDKFILALYGKTV